MFYPYCTVRQWGITILIVLAMYTAVYMIVYYSSLFQYFFIDQRKSYTIEKAINSVNWTAGITLFVNYPN